jgi:hypothetical protein
LWRHCALAVLADLSARDGNALYRAFVYRCQTSQADILGKLASQYPQLQVLNIDDFSSNVQSNVFGVDDVARIRRGLAGKMKLIPTFYYGHGKAGFVFAQNKWLVTSLMLFRLIFNLVLLGLLVMASFPVAIQASA